MVYARRWCSLFRHARNYAVLERNLGSCPSLRLQADEVKRKSKQTTVWLDPRRIRFTHDRISCRFRNRDHVDTAIARILDKELSPKDFPPMQCVRKDHKVYSLSNRRLYVFRVCKRRVLEKERTFPKDNESTK